MTLVNARQRHLSATEPLALRHLPQEGLAFDEPLTESWLQNAIAEGNAAHGLQFKVARSGRIVLEVMPLGPVDQRPLIRVRGRLVDAAVETDCVRCLQVVQPSLEVELDLTLLPGPPEEKPAEGKSKGSRRKVNEADDRLEDWGDEQFPHPDELADGQYRGERIDLPEIIREGVVLGLSAHPVCEDESACDQRTAALIDEANAAVRAADNDLDPRWAALMKLKAPKDS